MIGTGLALLSGAAGVVALAELAARLRYRRLPYRVFSPYTCQRLFLADGTHPGLHSPVHWEINELGERGGPPLARRADVYRVLAAGGSAAEGYLLDQPVSWTGQLERLLDAPEPRHAFGRRRVHVGSIARSRVGSEELRVMFERVLPTHPRLDAIVILTGATDVVRWLEEGTQSPWSPRPIDHDRLFAQNPRRSFGLKPRQTALWQTLRHFRKRAMAPVQDRQGVGRSVQALREKRRRVRERVREIPDPAPMLDRFTQHMEHVLRLADAAADRVVVAQQPCFADIAPELEEELIWNFAVGNVYAEGVEAYYDLTVVAELMRRMNERAEQVARRWGAAVVDLQTEVEQSAEAYYDFLHFTPLGANQVAVAVANRLVSPYADRSRSRDVGRAV